MNIKTALGLSAIFFGTPVAAQDFFDHLKVCHDTVWQIEEFSDLPNAAVSVHLGGFGDDSFYAYWIVDWDDVQVAGKCIMQLQEPVIVQLTDFRD